MFCTNGTYLLYMVSCWRIVQDIIVYMNSGALWEGNSNEVKRAKTVEVAVLGAD